MTDDDQSKTPTSGDDSTAKMTVTATFTCQDVIVGPGISMVSRTARPRKVLHTTIVTRMIIIIAKHH